MNRSMVLCLFGTVLGASSACADMIEVKDKGFLNGVVVSENDKEVQFKDAKGDIHVFPKKDVLFMDIDKADTGGKKTALTKTIKEKTAQVIEAAKRAPQKLKQSTDQATKKFTGSLSKPLDRSHVDSQSRQLSKAMDEASQAAGGMNKKVLTANEELKRQQKLGEQGENRVKSGGGYVDNYDAKKGRFGSLD